jgi:hypothetical protein
LLSFGSWCGDAVIAELLFVAGSKGALGGAYMASGRQSTRSTERRKSPCRWIQRSKRAPGGADHLIARA